MAEDKILNGIMTPAEEFYDPDQDGSASEGNMSELLKKKIEALHHEGEEKVAGNAERKEEIKKLMLEIDGLRSNEAEMKEKIRTLRGEVEQSLEAQKAVEVIASRAAELETEVARLQHDMISEMSAAEEARTDAAELRRVLKEKESRLENLEREVEGLKQGKVDSDMKVRDLERKVGVLEKREIEEKSKKIRVEEEMRDKIDEKEKQIRGFTQKIEELEMIVVEKGSELETWVKEKLNLEEALRESEEKARNMESNIAQLRENAEEAEKVIRTLKEKAVEVVNTAVNGVDDEVKGLKGLNLQWPAVAGTVGAIAAAAAVIYVCYGRRR